MGYPRNDTRAPKEPREAALPVGLWLTLYLREPVEGSVDCCSTYGVRLTTESGFLVYASHANILGAVGKPR